MKCFRLFGFIAITVLISAMSGLAQAEEPATPPIVAECKADLAKRFELKVDDIALIEAKPVTWPDSALGMPEIGKMYAQVLTPGYRIILEGRGAQYLYTTSEKAFRYGGPAYAWACSILYLKPVKDEPNMNGNLYQCSLMGTNSVLLASGVSEYYPQERGHLVFTRRTSRSGFDLLCLKVDGKSKPVTLHSSFAFGDAAVNEDGTQWAAFARPMVGAGWKVTIGGISEGSDVQTLSLPDGFSPGQIAWSGENLMIMPQKVENADCFEISPKAEKPEWKKANYYDFPGNRDFVLNKSQSLGIDQLDENGKPVVDISIVWFNGNHDPITRIEGLKMKGCDFLIGLYAFVWGEKDSKPAIYAVDTRNGEIITGPGEVAENMKPFQWPPQNNPLVVEK